MKKSELKLLIKELILKEFTDVCKFFNNGKCSRGCKNSNVSANEKCTFKNNWSDCYCYQLDFENYFDSSDVFNDRLEYRSGDQGILRRNRLMSV